MNHVDFMGHFAGILTTTAFVPQVVRTWRTRSTGDISLLMFLLLSTGLLLWVVYGVYINSLPMILANGVTLLLAGVILYLKLRYPRSTH